MSTVLGAAIWLSLSASPTYAQSVGSSAVGTGEVYSQVILAFVFVSSILAIAYGFAIRSGVSKLSSGTEKMQSVGQSIRDGALAYLRKQVAAMLPFVVLLCVVLFFLFNWQTHFQTSTAIGVAVFFAVGVVCSYAAGYVGMNMATSGNQRTAFAALSSYKKALETAFRSGAVAGMMTVGLGLLGAISIFAIYGSDVQQASRVLEGFGFGGSLAALFMRVGGGIFTKAADVGADLVGKVEHSIPEDDPRNPATIADNVGDNVGDCAGMAADVFESYIVTLVASIVLGASAGEASHSETVLKTLVLLPFVIHGIGILASILGVASVKGRDEISVDPLVVIMKGMWTTAAIATALFGAAIFLLPQFSHGVTIGSQTFGPYRFFGCTVLGVILAMVISLLTEYFTGSDKRPVIETAQSARTGAATLILTGFSLGLESATWGAIAIAATLFIALAIFDFNSVMSAYGIALAGLGLLTTCGYVLAMDTFGPISDNANGIFEMSGVLNDKSQIVPGAIPGDKVVARLDSAGNTTKALTKGFAIATAVIAAVALFKTFVGETGLKGLPLDDPRVFIGLLIGGSAPYLFSSFAIKAVSRAAQGLVLEVRRQFKEFPGIMLGTETPDYARCVSISTSAAQKELLGPGILAICLPILIGFGLGPASLGGYLAGAIVSGQLMAVLLANSGGAWDNAKKKIEDGMLGGKGSDAHIASIIGDTVGDPFKDTAGPALNPLIKVMNLVGVLIAGAISVGSHIDPVIRVAVIIITSSALVYAVIQSKRPSEFEAALDIDNISPGHLSDGNLDHVVNESPLHDREPAGRV